ncbi:MAG: acylphosphatase [Vulcanimicrobiota bacterium]
MRRIRVFYTGIVQGVGFRYTAREIARHIGVSGWVKNLRDGRVEITAEADEALLYRLMDELERSFSNFIRHRELFWDEATNEFEDFRVAF